MSAGAFLACNHKQRKNEPFGHRPVWPLCP